MLNILELKSDQIKEQVINFLDQNLDQDYLEQTIEQAIIINDDIFKSESDDHLIKTIDFYISDQAGTYLYKEILEFFGFVVDESDYKDDLFYYIDLVDRTVLKYADNYLNKNIDLEEGLYLSFTIESGFKLDLIIDYDYIPEHYQNLFIAGQDVDLLKNLTNGYIALFEYDDEMLFIKSFYDQDSNSFHYSTIHFFDLNDLESFISDYDLDSDFTFKDSNNKRSDYINLISDIDQNPFKFGSIFDQYNQADHLIDLLSSALN